MSVVRKMFQMVLVLIAAFLFGSGAVLAGHYNTDTLILAHVIFRHGDRTPDAYGLWKTNPYYNESFYEPYGYGQLTNDGKRREFDLGTALRNRYDSFLDDTWNVKMYDAWSTNTNRTKMSMSLVLAGLFPPKGCMKWKKGLLWQPIPFNYLPTEQDKELSSWACPTVLPLIYNDTRNVERLQEYDGLMEALRQGTGENVDYISALDLYFGMQIQTELGLPLEAWTEEVFPEPLRSYVVDFYYIETSTVELKRVIAGYILGKILTDSLNKISGRHERKIFLYSGHEVNAATILTSLEAFDLKSPPPYGSYLVFEVHCVDEVYGIKMFYEDYEAEEPHVLTLPGCEEFCPFDDFLRLTADIIPESDDACFAIQ